MKAPIRNWLGIGADENGVGVSDVAEAMRDTALEVVALTGPKHTHLLTDRQFDLTLNDDTTLFAFVFQHACAGIAAGRHDLAQQTNLTIATVFADQVVVNVVGADIGLFFDRIERTVLTLGDIQGKELRQRNRYAAQHLFQRTDRRTDLILLDQRDGAVGHARALGQFALAETFERADGLQPKSDVQ
jgi:hypothetical protein